MCTYMLILFYMYLIVTLWITTMQPANTLKLSTAQVVLRYTRTSIRLRPSPVGCQLSLRRPRKPLSGFQQLLTGQHTCAVCQPAVRTNVTVRAWSAGSFGSTTNTIQLKYINNNNKHVERWLPHFMIITLWFHTTEYLLHTKRWLYSNNI